MFKNNVIEYNILNVFAYHHLIKSNSQILSRWKKQTPLFQEEEKERIEFTKYINLQQDDTTRDLYKYSLTQLLE